MAREAMAQAIAHYWCLKRIVKDPDGSGPILLPIDRYVKQDRFV